MHAGHQEVACRGYRTLRGRITILVVLQEGELEGATQGVQDRRVALVQGGVLQEVVVGDGLREFPETHRLGVVQDVVQGELLACVGH